MNNFLSHFYPFLRRAGYLLIAGASLLIGIFFLYRSSGARTETVKTVKVVPVDATSSRRQSFPVIDFDSEFYKTIIDNNLFRPLGWRPSRPKEPYRLIGTIISTDGKTVAQAILQTTRGNMTYTVMRGDTLDADTTVIDIQPKQVTLEKTGQQRGLRLNPILWLK